MSTRSSGGSYSPVTTRSGGGLRTASGRSSTPDASRCAYAASKPNRASTSPAGRAAKSASVRIAQPAQQVGQVGPVQGGHVHPTEELRRFTGRHDLPGPRGEHGREGAVGDTGLGLHATDERDVLDQPLGRLLLPAVVTGRPPGGDRAGTGPDHLHPGSQLLDRGHDRLVRARVPARIVLHHGQLWATSLGLPFA